MVYYCLTCYPKLGSLEYKNFTAKQCLLRQHWWLWLNPHVFVHLKTRLQSLNLWSHDSIVNDMDFFRVLEVKWPCWLSLWSCRTDSNTRIGVCEMRSWARGTLNVRIFFFLMYNFRQKSLSLNARTHLNKDISKFHHIQVQTHI